MRVSWLWLAVWLSCLWPLSANAAQTKAAALTLVDPEKGPIALVFDSGTRQPEAKVTADMHFIVRGTPQSNEPVALLPRHATRLRAALSSSSTSLGDGLARVDAEITVSADVDIAELDGLLRVNATKKTKPLLVEVVAHGPALKLQPGEEVKLDITKPWDFWNEHHTLGEAAQARLAGDGGDQPLLVPKTVALLRSDDGGEAEVELRVANKVSATSSAVALKVLNATGAGTYTGAVPIRGVDGLSEVKVSATITDFFLWPLLVLIFGALLGGAGVQSFERHRRRQIMRAALLDIQGRYRVAAKGLSGPNDLSNVVAAEGKLPRWRCADNSPKIEKLACAISRARGNDSLDTVAKQTTEIVAEINRWLVVAEAYTGLDEQLQSSPPSGTAKKDSELLLAALAQELHDDAEAQQLAGAASDQTALLQAAANLRAVVAQLEDDGRNHPELDPDTVYAKVPPPMMRTHAQVHDALARFSIALQQAHDLLDTEQRRSLTEDAAMTAVQVARKFPLARPENATSVLASLRRWDFALGTVVALITAIAFLLPTYIGDPFGGWADYLKVFCAGFVGQAAGGLVINWSLFPSGRNYKIGAPAAPDKSDG